MAADAGSITVYRTWATATIYAIKIFVDEVEIGRLRPGQTLQVDVPPGSHVVRPDLGGIGGKSLSSRAAVEIQTGPSESVAVRVAVGKFGLFELKVDRSPVEGPGTTSTAAAMNPQVPTDEASAEPSAVSCQISDGERFEVDVGLPEVRVIDNSDGVSDVVRTFKLSRTWTRSYTTETEAALRATAGGSVPWVRVKAEIEGALTQHLSRSFQEHQTFEDTVVVTSAAQTKTTVYFAWKEIRQRGTIRVLTDGVVAAVPFEGVVGISFDQRQVDERGA